MADEIALRSAAERGARAKALLEDEMLVAAFAGLERAYLDAWKASAARDTDGRERLWQALQILSAVPGHLHSIIANGKIAQYELDALTERKTP